MSNKYKKISIADKIIMLIRRREYLVCLDFGHDPEVVFNNGEIYKCSGEFSSEKEITIFKESLRLMSRPDIRRSRTDNDVLRLIEDDLINNGIVVTVK